MATANAFDAQAHSIESRMAPRRMAVLSIDVEHDYNGDGSHALNRLPDLLAAVARAGAPLSAFVEGRLFKERPELCAGLVEAGVDLHLHCYDHRQPTDTVASLHAGIDAFGHFVGAPPRGYRANTYRLTEELFGALIAQGFAWDSSILPGIGFGNHRAAAYRRGDWFLLDDALAELPLASWRALGIPFTQAYRQLLGAGAEAVISRFATLPQLLIYDMHMVDLVPDGRLREAKLPLWMKAGHALVRLRQRGFEDLAALVERLRADGYQWMTMTQCHATLAAMPA